MGLWGQDQFSLGHAAEGAGCAIAAETHAEEAANSPPQLMARSGGGCTTPTPLWHAAREGGTKTLVVVKHAGGEIVLN